MQSFKAENISTFSSHIRNRYQGNQQWHRHILWWRTQAGLALQQVNDRLNIGASYQSRLYMTEFDDYTGLFAEQAI